MQFSLARGEKDKVKPICCISLDIKQWNQDNASKKWTFSNDRWCGEGRCNIETSWPCCDNGLKPEWLCTVEIAMLFRQTINETTAHPLCNNALSKDVWEMGGLPVNKVDDEVQHYAGWCSGQFLKKQLAPTTKPYQSICAFVLDRGSSP